MVEKRHLWEGWSKVGERADNSSGVSGIDKRREESREKILDAAEDQLRAEELELFSIDRVLSRAEVSVGTFYRIFSGKEALLRAVQERLYARMQPAILEALKEEEEVLESINEASDRAFGVMIDHVLAEGELSRAFMMLSALDPELRATMREAHIQRRDALTAVLEKHREEINHPDPDTAIHHAYHLYLATIYGRLAFFRPGAGRVFGVDNSVFFDQLKLSIRNFLCGNENGRSSC